MCAVKSRYVEPCIWEGCNRLGMFPNGALDGEGMCSYHHPAGRTHIEDRDRRIADLLDALEFVIREVEVEHPKETCECAIASAVDRGRAVLQANGRSA